MSWQWWICTQEKGSICPHKSLYADIHSHVIHSGQKVEMLRGVYKELSFHMMGDYPSIKRKYQYFLYRGKPRQHSTKWKKPETKDEDCMIPFIENVQKRQIRDILMRNEQCCICHARFLPIDSKHQVPWDSGVWTWASPSSSAVLIGPAGICYGRCCLWLAVINGATPSTASQGVEIFHPLSFRRGMYQLFPSRSTVLGRECCWWWRSIFNQVLKKLQNNKRRIIRPEQ